MSRSRPSRTFSASLASAQIALLQRCGLNTSWPCCWSAGRDEGLRDIVLSNLLRGYLGRKAIFLHLLDFPIAVWALGKGLRRQKKGERGRFPGREARPLGRPFVAPPFVASQCLTELVNPECLLCAWQDKCRGVCASLRALPRQVMSLPQTSFLDPKSLGVVENTYRRPQQCSTKDLAVFDARTAVANIQ